MAVTGATLLGASTLNAQADTVQQTVKNNDVNVNPQTPQQAAQQRVDTAQQQVNTQQQVVNSGVQTVNNAQNTVKADQSAVNAQQAVVNSAAAEATSASAAVESAVTSAAQNQDNVQSAASAVQAANSAVSDQQQVVNSNSAQVNSDQSAVSSAKELQASAEARLSDYIVASQAAATSAFNFALENAQKAVNDQQDAVNAASQAVNTAQSAVQAQQNAVSIAQQTASQAAAQVAKDASAVADAQQRLDALKNNGSNDNVTATAQLQSTISQLQKQLANDKQAAQNAQQMLESAQQNYDHATAAQKAAEEKVNQTKAALAKAQQAVTTAQANADAAQQKVATAKADALKALETYNNYKNDNGVPTVKTPSDIVQQYESYINGNRYNSPQVKSDCAEGIALNGGDPAKGLMSTGWTSTDGGKTWTPLLKTSYQATAQDKTEKVDPRNMTAAQQTEITKFAAQIVNSFRDSFQSTAAGAAHSYGKVKVSPYATELGNQVIDGAYNNSGWNKSSNATGSPHNENGMVAAANKAGLNTGFVGENLSTGLLLDPASLHIAGLKQSMSMADVKQSIYAGILAMIYQDVENAADAPLYYGFGGHTEAFLNDPKGMNGISYDDNGNQYMTVTIDKDGWVHYNFFDDGHANAEVKNKLAQGATTPENVSAAQINNAHNDYLQKEGAVTTAQTAATAAKNGVTTAQANVATAQTAVNNATAAQQKAANETLNQKAVMENAQAAVNLANDKINDLQAKLAKVQADLNAMNGSVQDKARQLAQAQNNLAAAQQKLSASKKVQASRDAAVNEANAKLNQLQQNVQAKQNDLQQAQSELQNKKNEYAQLNSQIRLAKVFGTSLAAVSPQSNYEKAISDAKKAVASAQQKLSDDTQVYKASQAKLQELTATVSQLQTIYEAALSNAKKSDAVQNDAAVKKAKTALAAAQLKVQVETGKLTQLKGTLDKDQTTLDVANGDLTKAQEKLNSLQGELKRAQITLDGLSHPYIPSTPVVDETASKDETATSSSATNDVSSATTQTKTTATSDDNASTSAVANDASQNETETQEANVTTEANYEENDQQVLTSKVQNPGSLNRASEEASVKSEIAAQIAARNAHAANDNMMAGFDDPYDNYYDLQQEAASIPSAPLEGYTRQLGGGKINAKLEAAIKSGQIKLPSSNTKSEAKKQPKVNKDSLTAMTVVAAGAALATGASLNKKRKNKVAKKLEDHE